MTSGGEAKPVTTFIFMMGAITLRRRIKAPVLLPCQRFAYRKGISQIGYVHGPIKITSLDTDLLPAVDCTSTF